MWAVPSVTEVPPKVSSNLRLLSGFHINFGCRISFLSPSALQQPAGEERFFLLQGRADALTTFPERLAVLGHRGELFPLEAARVRRHSGLRALNSLHELAP